MIWRHSESCSRFTYLQFVVIFLYVWGIPSSLGANVTVDNTDPSILYLPEASWASKLATCATGLNCEAGDITSYPRSYHEVIRPATSHITRRREAEELYSGQNLDKSMTTGGASLRFQFNGSAVYAYCLHPAPCIGATFTMNLTFYINNQEEESFLFSGTSNQATGCIPGTNVFSKTDLSPHSSHVLQIDVGPDSFFMLDYLVYTQSDFDQDHLSSRDVAPPPTLAVLVDNSTTNEGTRKHNIATFAGAIGGSVGVLVLLSSGLAFSIIKRRRSYERRERDRERAALEGQADGDSPAMIGPRPFIPRFFPETNTVIPPPYEESTPDNASRSDISHPHSNPSNADNLMPATPPTHSLPVSAHLDRADHDDTSYANIPPSTPPPPLEDIDSLPPPPPFTPGMENPDVRAVHAI